MLLLKKVIKRGFRMEKEIVLQKYAEIGINSQNGLYEFLINNNEAILDNTNYNLNNSNETMEFMAPFLEALGFEVIRLYIEKEKNIGNKKEIQNFHWFLAFHSGLKWYYYETVLKEIQGQYTFENYNNLTTFAAVNLVNVLESKDDEDKDYEKYTLKEIKPLDNLNITDNIKQSQAGTEILVWSDLVGNFNYEQFIIRPEAKKKISRRKRKNTNFGLFIIGFSFTLVICLLILWIFAIIYYGNK